MSDAVIPIATGISVTVLSFFLIYYLHHNFSKLNEKTDALTNKQNQLENVLTALKEKLDFVFKLLDDLEDSNNGNFNQKIKEIEASIQEISKEIIQLDKNSLIRTKDLQSVSDLLKDLSHDTEIKFREQDYHYASALEDIEELKKKCEMYKDKILKIEFQLNSLQQNLKRPQSDEI